MNGVDDLEMRVMLPLPADDAAAADRVRLAMVAVDLILHVVLTGRLGPVREAYRRLTGVQLR
jgi:hypothetical protein